MGDIDGQGRPVEADDVIWGVYTGQREPREIVRELPAETLLRVVNACRALLAACEHEAIVRNAAPTVRA